VAAGLTHDLGYTVRKEPGGNSIGGYNLQEAAGLTGWKGFKVGAEPGG
jgi:hypothetical protein